MSTTTEDRPADRAEGRGRHPVNISHLVMGVAFLGVVGIWLLLQTGAVTDDATRWLLPLPWIIAGTTGLLAATVTARRRHQPRSTPPAHERPAHESHEESR